MAIDGLSQPSKKITLPRPGHADLPGLQKFGFDDIRPVIERASARETAMRVALGSIARKLLEVFGIEIGSHVVAIGSVVIDDTEKTESTQDIYKESDEICGFLTGPVSLQTSNRKNGRGHKKGPTAGRFTGGNF